jgi:hypothetical protein
MPKKEKGFIALEPDWPPPPPPPPPPSAEPRIGAMKGRTAFKVSPALHQRHKTFFSSSLTVHKISWSVYSPGSG